MGFFDLQLLICEDVFHFLHDAGRPMDFERSSLGLAQAQMNPEITGRGVPYAISNRGNLCTLATAADHFSTKSRGVTLRPFELELQPMLHRTAVHPEFDGLIERGYGRVHTPIVVEIRKSHAAVYARHGKVRARSVGHIDKTATYISEHSVGLGFVCVEAAAGNEGIQPAVVVEVNEPASPAIPGTA